MPRSVSARGWHAILDNASTPHTHTHTQSLPPSRWPVRSRTTHLHAPSPAASILCTACTTPATYFAHARHSTHTAYSLARTVGPCTASTCHCSHPLTDTTSPHPNPLVPIGPLAALPPERPKLCSAIFNAQIDRSSHPATLPASSELHSSPPPLGNQVCSYRHTRVRYSSTTRHVPLLADVIWKQY